MMTRRWLYAAIATAAGVTHAQGTVTVSWINAVQNADCSLIPAWNSTDPGRLLSTTIEYGTLSGSTFSRVGEVTVPMPGATLELSAVVMQEFAVRGRHRLANGTLGGYTIPAQIGDPPTPLPACIPPAVLPASAVLSTRIESAEWTCRDSAGAILSSHTRQDKAQESCTNRALAAPGVAFEIRPSGYRIVAQ
jgi:hypothetical protein